MNKIAFILLTLALPLVGSANTCMEDFNMIVEWSTYVGIRQDHRLAEQQRRGERLKALLEKKLDKRRMMVEFEHLQALKEFSELSRLSEETLKWQINDKIDDFTKRCIRQ